MVWWTRVSHKSSKYSWPSEADLKALVQIIKEDVAASHKVTWAKLCPSRSPTDRTGILVLWDRDKLSDTSDLSLSPFKGEDFDTSSHCRKLNSLLQMEQPLWKRLEEISCYRKQKKEIKAFMKKMQKESPIFDFASYHSDDSNSEDHCKDHVRNSFNDAFASMASKCSIRSKPEKVSLRTSYYPMTKTHGFMDRLAEQLRTIETQNKYSQEKLREMLEEGTVSTSSSNEAQERGSVCLAAETSLDDRLPFPPGPVGESPLHTCFLLGLRRLGIEIINRYYDTPELVSTPYLNDLDPWRKLVDERSKSSGIQAREDGLYTGETVLHIAIVQEDMMLVKHLLHLGIEISSRARGVFFQPRLLKPLSVDLNRWQRLKAWLLGVDLKCNKFASVSSIENRDSGTYYGEYPLSFAASVGSIEICNILYYYKKLRIESHDDDNCKMSKRERESCRPQNAMMLKDQRSNSISKLNQHIPSLKSMYDLNHDYYSQNTTTSTTEKLMWDFLNAADTFGNTALHMAVWHQRKDAIDWLISKTGGEDSLNFINHDFFTPLTLAARRGHVDIFHHILYKHMGRTAWKYGKVGYATFFGIFVFSNPEI
jgi:ankyrin repeat protein